MKAIMISIKPKWVAKILNGEKTIEIRKSMPKCDLPIDVYIYCTKDKNLLVKLVSLFGSAVRYALDSIRHKDHYTSYFNGKVIAKFTLNKVEEITPQMWTHKVEQEILEKSCLKEYELFDYISKNNGEPDNPFFVWHISNLEIFDKPKELSEFIPYMKDKCMTSKCSFQKNYMCEVECNKPLTKAPQSWCYVEELE